MILKTRNVIGKLRNWDWFRMIRASSNSFDNRTSADCCIRCSSSTSHKNASSKEPFYGRPRETTSHSTKPFGGNSLTERVAIAVYNATTAFGDPTRADAVAALGDITAPFTLRRIHDEMMADPTGRRILNDRPVVSKATIPYEKLMAEAPEGIRDQDDLTFGQVYGSFLKVHGFDPDERDDVRFVQDETLAYIMLRYRQNHDFFHAITGLPPTVLGELGLKWLELFQTGLPIAALSCTVGSLRLNDQERKVLQTTYLPWALQNRNVSGFGTEHSGLPSSFPLMNVYYEEEFDSPIRELRQRLNLTPAPQIPV